MNACTTYETEIELAGQVYFVFAEVDARVTSSRASFEHFGFRGSRGESEAEVEVTGFSVFRTEDRRTEIDDRAIIRAIRPLIEAEVEGKTEELAERAGAYDLDDGEGCPFGDDNF